MDSHTFLLNLGIALVAAFVGGFLAKRLHLPVIIGYLLAGVVIGPNTPGVFANRDAVGAVAQLGVALLMFAVGVHFSLKELKSLWQTAVIGGGIQILGTVACGLVLGHFLGWGIYGGLFLGCSLALSSTAVMMKVLEERGEQQTSHGKVMLGILIVQDLSLVLMMILLPALSDLTSQGVGALSEVGIALLKAIVFLVGVIVLAIAGIPKLMRFVAHTCSGELFLLMVICLCLATGTAAEYAGLGIELGAFLAGLMISETDYSHEVFAQVRPLRDVFASLFFVSIGMLLEPRFVQQHAMQIASVVLTIVFAKSLVTILAVYWQGWNGGTAIRAGLGLAQIGEFSFVLASLGSARHLIPSEISGIILSSALITLLLAPFMFSASGGIYNSLSRIPALTGILNRHGAPEPTIAEAEHEPAKVLVVGYGRVGRYVSNALKANGVPHCVMDSDAKILEPLRLEGVRVVYGDATASSLLENAKPDTLELAVIALPEADATELTVKQLKRLAPELPVLVRVHRGNDIPRLRRAGADAVIHAEFEAGTEMIRQTLDRLAFKDDVVDGYLGEIRLHRYRQEIE